MKRLLLYIGIVALIASCTKSEITENIPTDGKISFSAGVSTRVLATNDCFWADSGDEVGIFTNQTDEENLMFSVDKNGAMTSDSKLYTLASGSRTYYAYHPYSSAQSTTDISIDLTEDAPNTPLLWASKTSNDANVEFLFKHQLVRADFNFKAGGGDIADLTGITAATIKGVNAKATFSIESGKFADNVIGNISLNIEDVKDGKITTYLIPTAKVNGKVTLEITAGDKIFTTPINTASWEGNKKYNYNVTVGAALQPLDYSDIATVNELLGTSDTDLRLSNCYMVDPATNSGCIIPVSRINTYWSDGEYGNNSGLKIGEDWTTNSDYTIEPLWNDFGLDSYDGQIAFSKVTGTDDDYAMQIEFAESFDSEGNMVIAVKNGGTIVWSWHIWITDYNPYTKTNGTTYTVDSDTNGTMLTWMDRNIGALGTAYSTSNNLYYQWGRKDPIRVITDDSDEVEADADRTIADVVKSPTKFYFGTSDTGGDWCGNDTDWDQCRDHHWRDAKLPSINDSDIKYGLTKSIYDPSPLGFMVPCSTSEEFWSSPFAFVDKQPLENTGATYSNIFFPALGYRAGMTGPMLNGEDFGFYWSASSSTKTGIKAYVFNFLNNLVFPSDVFSYIQGCSVRPIKEFQLND